MTDQNGTTHQYSYDVLGRQTLDAVTTLGSGVDGTVRAIGATYNSQGLPFQQTSYSDAAATTVVNQVQDVYNGLGQLVTEYQAHSGSVNTSTTPSVGYAYSDPSLGSRQTSMTYPNGRVLNTIYNTGLDTAIGRVSALADAGGSAAGTDQSYVYQGLGTIVGTTDGNGVVETTTLDTFGRTAEMKYVNASSVTTDDFAYGYDRNGNVLYKNNLLSSTNSELYHANSAVSGDNNTAYDPLNRLTGFSRGTLSSSGNNGTALDTVTSPSGSQSWNLNAVGDQASVMTNGTTTANSTNAKNELTANGSNSLTFDHNGNTTTDENGQSTTYDAWNHAITVKNSGGTTIASYSYDPQGRRITEAAGGVTTDIYFTNQWQAIEERQGGTVTRQDVWGQGYVNQLVERDDNSTSGSLGITRSGFGRRLYGQQDANWSVTSLVDASGTVVHRMTYLPYGVVTFLTASWSPGTDAYGQTVLFQGGRLETATGNYIFDYRDYDPATGSWSEQDPAGTSFSYNRYGFGGNNPVNGVDPLGLFTVTFVSGLTSAQQQYITKILQRILDRLDQLTSQLTYADAVLRVAYSEQGKCQCITPEFMKSFDTLFNHIINIDQAMRMGDSLKIDNKNLGKPDVNAQEVTTWSDKYWINLNSGASPLPWFSMPEEDFTEDAIPRTYSHCRDRRRRVRR